MVYRENTQDIIDVSSVRYAGRNADIGFSENQVPEWWVAALQRIGELLNLPDNWDSYGAKKLDKQRAFYAVEVLQQISRPGVPRPSIVPTVTGNLQFEWHTNDMDLEIEVKSQVKLSLYNADLRTGEEQEFELDYDLAPLSKVIKEIINRVRAASLAA